MRYTIIVPHWKNGKTTAYCISNIMRHSQGRQIRVIIVDNSFPDPSIAYLSPFLDNESIEVVPYPEGLAQSHGIAFAYALQEVDTEWFITVESDSFPTEPGWLDYYDKLIANGYDAAGSFLKLSGGHYMHPAGALYNKKIYDRADAYCRGVKYHTFPGMAEVYEGVGAHVMVLHTSYNKFLENPGALGIQPTGSYAGLTPGQLVEKEIAYRPVLNAFHAPYGNNNEEFETYGKRSMRSEPERIIQQYDKEIILRMGLEPGQFFAYWMSAMGYNLFPIPTETKWLFEREFQQQEHTITEHGFKHLWGVSAYYKADIPAYQDIIDHKHKVINELYETLPENEKHSIRD
jgi:hypothetical protein